jgi:hypothetical protein
VLLLMYLMNTSDNHLHGFSEAYCVAYLVSR